MKQNCLISTVNLAGWILTAVFWKRLWKKKIQSWSASVFLVSANLDEFFMVRVAGVKAQISSGYQNADASGLTPTALFTQLQEKIHKFVEKQYSCCQRSVIPALKKQGIVFLTPNEMDKKQQKYIFNKYYQANKNSTSKKGYGLGLNYVYNVIKAHKGKITVGSLPGKGCTFTIYLHKWKKK